MRLLTTDQWIELNKNFSLEDIKLNALRDVLNGQLNWDDGWNIINNIRARLNETPD